MIQAGCSDARDVRVRLVSTSARSVVESMTVSDLLRSQTRWGRTRVRKFLIPLAVNENRELGRLTVRQRGELARRLEAKATR